MRTFILIGCLAILGNLQKYKVTATSDPDIYLEEEEDGSGDAEALYPDSLSPHTTHLPPPDQEEEAGSGTRPEGKGGGAPPDQDAEEEDDYYYDEKEEEGSAWYPSLENEYKDFKDKNDAKVSKDDDFGILAKEDIFEEIPVDSGPSFEDSPERMPSSTPPPTLTDTHHDMDNNNIRILTQKDDERQVSIFAQPGILAAFIGGAVMGLLCAILLVMFIVYRMRKRDEGSYPLDEPKRVPLTSSYSPNDKEIYA